MPIDKNRSLLVLHSPYSIARQYFPDEPNHVLSTIIWGCTGYPCFWHDKTKSPHDNFREQLKEAQEKGWEKVIDEAWPD